MTVKMGAVFGIALFIWFITMVTGSFSTRTLVGLLFYLLIGSVFPPFAVGLGAVVILYLLIVKNQQIGKWVSDKLGGNKNG